MYNHFLLLAPDDEFFDPQSNPLSMDEVLELSVIWRDLAFWGYMAGVRSAGGQPGQAGTGGASMSSGASGSDMRGSEEDRALFTRGVTRLTERKYVAAPAINPSHLQGGTFREEYESADMSQCTSQIRP